MTATLPKAIDILIVDDSELVRTGLRTLLDAHSRTTSPMLRIVGAELASGVEGRVIACSALRRRYRDVIREACPAAAFVELVVSADELEDRLGSRAGHFMPASLLASQLDALEPLGSDEAGVRVENVGSVEDVVSRAIAALEAGW